MSKHKEKLIYTKNEQITALAIDSHAHLDRLETADGIIKNMRADGLKKIVLMAGDIKTAIWASEMCAKTDGLYYMFGLHPYDIHNFNQEFVDTITKLRATDPKLVGLGEIGLDYKPREDMETPEFQQEIFSKQLKLADSLSLPVSIHIRDAHADAIKLLKHNKNLLNHGGIIHCCSADKTEVKEYLSLGFHISFSGSITYGKKNQEYYLEETVRAVPLDKLLIETDCPFLCPAPYRGGINEPKYVLVTAEKVSEILGINVNELIKITTENAEKLLKI